MQSQPQPPWRQHPQAHGVGAAQAPVLPAPCPGLAQAPGQAARGVPALTALPPPSLVPLQGGHRGLAAGELGMPHVPKHSSSDHTSRPSHGGCTAAHGAQSCPLQEGTARTRDTRPGSSASTSPAALALPVPSPPVEQQHSHPTFHPADIGAPVPTDRNTEARVNQPSALPLHPILG